MYGLRHFCRDGWLGGQPRTLHQAWCSMAADAAATISVETATLLRDVNKNDVDTTDPFSCDEKFEDDETIVDDE